MKALSIFHVRALAWSMFVLCATPVCGQLSTDPLVNNPISTATNDQLVPKSIPDGSGGAIIAWADFRSGPSNGDIYAQRMSASGSVLWTLNGVAVTTAANNQLNLDLVSDGAGGAIIVWRDARNGIFNNDIYAQRINASGSLLLAGGRRRNNQCC
jgi:hypothetical protein